MKLIYIGPFPWSLSYHTDMERDDNDLQYSLPSLTKIRTPTYARTYPGAVYTAIEVGNVFFCSQCQPQGDNPPRLCEKQARPSRYSSGNNHSPLLSKVICALDAVSSQALNKLNTNVKTQNVKIFDPQNAGMS